MASALFLLLGIFSYASGQWGQVSDRFCKQVGGTCSNSFCSTYFNSPGLCPNGYRCCTTQSNLCLTELKGTCIRTYYPCNGKKYTFKISTGQWLCNSQNEVCCDGSDSKPPVIATTLAPPKPKTMAPPNPGKESNLCLTELKGTCIRTNYPCNGKKYTFKISTGQWLCNSQNEVCCDDSDSKLPVTTITPAPPKPGKVTCGVPPAGTKLGRTRVINGKNAIKGAWPWQVSLRFGYRRSHTCGGTLIGDQWVLTAAHCFLSNANPRYFVVRLGDHHVFQTEGTEYDYAVDKILTHAGYSGRGNSNDIALLKLKAKVTMSQHIHPACLPAEGEDHQADGLCWTTGWGETRGTGDSRTLQEVQGSIWPHSQCSRVWYGRYTRGMLCFGNGLQQSCKGDSGGPLVCLKNNKFNIVGIVSFGTDECVKRGIPAVYTDAAHYLKWIKYVMQNY